MSEQARADQRSVDLAKVSTVTATAIAVADMIGIGVFTSLGFQVGGIVGHRFLSNYRVSIDLERSMLRLKKAV